MYLSMFFFNFHLTMFIKIVFTSLLPWLEPLQRDVDMKQVVYTKVSFPQTLLTPKTLFYKSDPKYSLTVFTGIPRIHP